MSKPEENLSTTPQSKPQAQPQAQPQEGQASAPPVATPVATTPAVAVVEAVTPPVAPVAMETPPAMETPKETVAPEEPAAKQVAKKPVAKKKGKKGAMPPKPPAATKGLEAVALRNNFYRDGYRLIKFVAVLQAFVLLVLAGTVFWMVKSQKVEHVYFATTEDGRLVKMSALSEPNLSTPALMSWSAQALAQTMTFGFHDYRKRLQESSRFFTRPGWAKFTEALERSGIMETVEANQQVVTAAPRSAPVVVQEGIVNGRYEWIVEVPMNITYKAGSKVRSDSPTVRLKIVRVPKLENAHGVGIEQWLQ